MTYSNIFLIHLLKSLTLKFKMYENQKLQFSFNIFWNYYSNFF